LYLFLIKFKALSPVPHPKSNILGFLVFNFYPAKIFPGDSGSYFLGFLVAVIAIFSVAKVGTAILVMAVPLIDGVFTILRRMASAIRRRCRRKSGFQNH